MDTWKVGVIGCGNISGIYFQNLAKFRRTEVVACADLDAAKAREAAEKFGIPKVCSPDDLLEDPDVQVVLNLTVPLAHFVVSKSALVAGKHVYVEKPLAVEESKARELSQLAKEKGLRLGCAPDTVLGAGIQTCRRLIDEGAIGRLVGANAFMLCPGHESWHPSPEFYYQQGGGPLLDMGPYYISALVTLMGGVSSVIAESRKSFASRTVTSEPKRGKVIEVEVPTHVVGLLSFANQAVAQLTTSFDVQRSTLPCIEIYGSEGTILVPDPNGFSGPVKLFRKGHSDWEDVPLSHPFAENSRGLGLLEMVCAIEARREHRLSSSFCLHVTEVMLGNIEAAEADRRVTFDDPPNAPAPMPYDSPKDDICE